MTDNFEDWVECPNCGYNLSEDDIQGGEPIVCPECDSETDEAVSGRSEPSMEELAEISGRTEEEMRDMLTPREREPWAEDAEEVTEDGIEFKEPQEYYVAGGQVFTCPKCGSDCQMSCGYGYADVGYCEDCRIEYKRSREPLVDSISDGVVTKVRREDRDVYEEYDCPHCDESHPYTKPEQEEYQSPEVEVSSLEEVSVNCLCGSRVHFNNASVGEEHKCDCGRVYSLDMQE